MRFSHRIKKQAIAQWNDCYIDYDMLKTLLKLVKASASDRIQFQRSIFASQIGNKLYLPNNFDSNQLIVPSQSKQHFQHFKQANQKANILLTQVLDKQIELFGIFSRYKLNQIEHKFSKAIKYSYLTQQNIKLQQNTLLPYLQKLFGQAFNLSSMYQTNIQAQRRIITKHELYSFGYFPKIAQKACKQLDINTVQKYIRQIQQFYIKCSVNKIQKSRNRIRSLVAQNRSSSKQSIFIGMMIGVFLAVCIFLGAMLIYQKNQVQTDPIFNADFPLWRGITLFLLYIWALGINLHHYQRYNINYRNIMGIDTQKYPTSKSFFKVAGFFSAILVIVFTIYALDVANVIVVRGINVQYLPLFVWLPFLFFLVNPISIIYDKSRTYLFKILFKSLISWIIPISYPIVYTSDQFVSLFTPFQDTVYTVCYYTKFKNVNNQPFLQTNDCKSIASITIFIFSIIIFVYRIMQCIKCGLQAKPHNIVDYFNGGKYAVALISTILSYIYNNGSQIFPAWLVFAILTSIYTYYWDLKYDWILLDFYAKHQFLRNKIAYPKKFYYILLFVNLLLRSSWALTLSPNIVRNFLGSPQVFILLFAFLEIIRRGIWNMLSVQAQHVLNCHSLNASPQQYGILDKQIDKLLLQNKDRITQVSVQRFVQTQSYFSEESVEDSISEKVLEQIKDKINAKNGKKKEMKIYIKQSHCQDLDLINYLFDHNYAY